MSIKFTEVFLKVVLQVRCSLEWLFLKNIFIVELSLAFKPIGMLEYRLVVSCVNVRLVFEMQVRYAMPDSELSSLSFERMLLEIAALHYRFTFTILGCLVQFSSVLLTLLWLGIRKYITSKFWFLGFGCFFKNSKKVRGFKWKAKTLSAEKHALETLVKLDRGICVFEVAGKNQKYRFAI